MSSRVKRSRTPSSKGAQQDKPKAKNAGRAKKAKTEHSETAPASAAVEETKDEVKAKTEIKAPATSKSKAKSKGKDAKAGGFDVDPESLTYLHGFGSEHSSEALEGALPKNITPQLCPYNLYAEQLSGTAFTAPRAANQRAWLYRTLPSCKHPPLQAYDEGKKKGGARVGGLVGDFKDGIIEPTQLRFKPFTMPKESEHLDFVHGLNTIGGAGSIESKSGFAIHIYAFNTSMHDTSFCNSDGDFLFVPQEGDLLIRTEFGYLHVPPRTIAVVQRGIRFAVQVNGPVRGYVLEVFAGHFKLPDLGPIGANGLANPRDFDVPTANYENKEGKNTLIQKFLGKLFYTEYDVSPFNVVAWFGNYYPYRFNLDKFAPVNAVAVDHMDPSIFTVLTCPTTEPGVATCDFVIFPPRWLVQEHTFRPPYYHRNCMTEFMGNICGKYEAKPDGFLPGGASLHSCMVAHGPESAVFAKASTSKQEPHRLPDDSLAFMFESTFIMKLTPWGAAQRVDEDYWQCWEGLKVLFDEKAKDPKAASAAAAKENGNGSGSHA